MRALVKLFGFLFVASIFVLPVILVALSLEKHPLVTENAPILLGDVEDAKLLKERYDPRTMPANIVTQVVANDAELNTTLAAGLTAFPRVKGRIEVGDSRVTLLGTLALPIPDFPFGHYLNVRAAAGPSDDGFDVKSFSVGHIPLPAGLVKPAIAAIIDAAVGPGKGKEMIASVKALRIDGNTVTVAFRPPPTLVADVRTAARRAIQVAGMDAIRAYYVKLVQLGQDFGYEREVSLAEFLGPSFALAKSRSFLGNPVEENRALILALSIYFGDSHFEQLLSDVKKGGLENIEPSIEHVYIEERNDWVQHFITSAGLQVAGGTAFANEIGEAKELSDSQGSEGFSFGDLAADHTGVRLGEIAVASDASARHLQDALANNSSESVFFPKITDFPEDLTEARFRARYGDVNSAAYLKQVKAIDDRIAQIPLYK